MSVGLLILEPQGTNLVYYDHPRGYNSTVQSKAPTTNDDWCNGVFGAACVEEKTGPIAKLYLYLRSLTCLKPNVLGALHVRLAPTNSGYTGIVPL